MDTYDFDQVFRLMEASFPKSERRTYAGQKALLTDPHYRLIKHADESNKLIAFLAVWEFPSFRFVEHIAVDSAIRGGGLGGKLMSAFLEESDIPVLLEVEPPDTELAGRRIGFYERLGFYVNYYDYVQPPLQKGQQDLPLHIMSYPQPLSEDDFTACKEVLYIKVYKIIGKQTLLK